MRILATLHHDLDPDAGAGGATLRLFEAVARGGHDVELVGLDVVPSGLPLPVRMSLFAPRVAPIIARTDADVVDASSGDLWVHTALWPRTRPPLLASRSHGLEHVLHAAELRAMADEGRAPSRANELFWRYRLGEVARSFRAADVALFLNDEEREVAVETFGLDPAATEIVDHGIAPHFLGRPRPRPTATPRVAFVGGLRDVKGGRVAIEVIQRALAASPEMTATFVGCGTEDVRRHLAPELRGRVDVVDRFRNPELPALLEGHAMVLATPYAEGFGMAVVEAMACGLAPVVFGVGGPQRIVRDGFDGRVVPPGDVAGAVQALVDLAADGRRLLGLRVSAHERANTFTWERAAAALVELYERRLQAGGATR